MSALSRSPIKSPCIGVCSTGIGDTVCRGCKRFCHEIIHWNSYSEAEREHIEARRQQLLAQVVREKVLVTDAARLQGLLRAQGVRFNEWADPHCWVFDLLKAGASQIADLEDYGIAPVGTYREAGALALRDAIDADFYTLSCVHYQRYFCYPSQ